MKPKFWDNIHWGNVMLAFVTAVATLSAIFGGRAFPSSNQNTNPPAQASPSPAPSASPGSH